MIITFTVTVPFAEVTSLEEAYGRLQRIMQGVDHETIGAYTEDAIISDRDLELAMIAPSRRAEHKAATEENTM